MRSLAVNTALVVVKRLCIYLVMLMLSSGLLALEHVRIVIKSLRPVPRWRGEHVLVYGRRDVHRYSGLLTAIAIYELVCIWSVMIGINGSNRL